MTSTSPLALMAGTTPATRHKLLLTEAEVEDLYGIPKRQLQAMRYRGSTLPYVKAGARCYYRRVDLDAWIASSIRTSTGGVAA